MCGNGEFKVVAFSSALEEEFEQLRLKKGLDLVTSAPVRRARLHSALREAREMRVRTASLKLVRNEPKTVAS
jgi:hypothetical protein